MSDAQSVTGEENSTTREKDHLVAGKPLTYVERISRPTMTVYSPTVKNTGAALAVFPGSGFKFWLSTSKAQRCGTG